MNLSTAHIDFAGAAAATDRHEIRDPGNLHDVVGSFPLLSVKSVDALVEAAATSQRAWAKQDPMNRWGTMRSAAATIPADSLAPLLVREQGKPLAEARKEMSSMEVILDRYKPHAEWLSETNSAPARDRTIRHRPYGVCGIITPWNWPFRIACALTVPALLAGNTVVLHLSPSAPLAAAQAFQYLAGALPHGVLSIVTHPDPSLASRIVEHPQVRKIAFTGSTEVGQIVMGNAASNLKSLTLELGGNDPAVILDDLDPTDQLADQLVNAAFATTGQVCMAIKRLYVPNEKVDSYVDAIGARLDQEVIGHGLNPNTTMGPLHTRAQREAVQSLVADAVASGAEVTEHGELGVDPADGWYLRPSLVYGGEQQAALVTQEQFGPALPIVGYSSADEAIALANSTNYGLCSSVWSKDQDRAFQVAELIEAGTTWINKHGVTAQDPQAPFGGIKSSGVGRISGIWGLNAFLEPHSLIA